MNLDFDMSLDEELSREVLGIKADAEPVASMDFYGDLFDGGYIDPEKFLADKQGIIDVKMAMRTIMYYRDALEGAGMIEEI